MPDLFAEYILSRESLDKSLVSNIEPFLICKCPGDTPTSPTSTSVKVTPAIFSGFDAASSNPSKMDGFRGAGIFWPRDKACIFSAWRSK